MELTKPDIIRNIPDGTTLLVGLPEGDSLESWRVRASEINAEEGWRHYTVGHSKFTGQVAITANEPNTQES